MHNYLRLQQGEIVLFTDPSGQKKVGIVLQETPPKFPLVHVILLTSHKGISSRRRFFVSIHDGVARPSEIVYDVNYTIEKKDIINKIGELSRETLYLFAKEYTWHLFPVLKDEVLHKLQKSINLLKSLLTHSPDEVEATFHNFLINNPVLLDPHGTVHNKPEFVYPAGRVSTTGKTKVIPDFIVSYSTQHYRLIEIERPNKETVTESGQQRATTTQAAFQLNEWEEFIESHPDQIEPVFPGIKRGPNRSYTLVVGRSSNLGGYSNINDLRTNLKRSNNCEVLTYDDLLQEAKDLYNNLKAMN